MNEQVFRNNNYSSNFGNYSSFVEVGSLIEFILSWTKCGYKYKSLKLDCLNLDAEIFQIIDCLNCNYCYRESWKCLCGGHMLEELESHQL